ncbi:MAG TPA: CBS domain-containing protein [Polyangia bacterium]|nr:CBS domain-containing protein [Polyangia bacterium]
MRIQDIMSHGVETITPGADVAAARNAMRVNGIRHLVVVDGQNVVGVVSDRDLGGRLSTAPGQRIAGRTVADVMSTSVVSVKPETTVRQAANLLRGFVIGSLVVQEGNKPVGIVTTTDLLDLIGRGAERPIPKSTRWTLRARGPRHTRPIERMVRG